MGENRRPECRRSEGPRPVWAQTHVIRHRHGEKEIQKKERVNRCSSTRKRGEGSATKGMSGVQIEKMISPSP